MYSKNGYLQFNPQLSPPRCSSDLNGVEILLHHGHPEMFCGHFLPTSNAPPLLDSALLNHDDGRGTNAGADPHCGISSNTLQRKQPGKKDRHSKIFTSQGPRDRRVRLSIGIARKFFDLQEMLGFDKPSKTLDWLLTKSKAAIKDLVQQSSGKSTSSPSECEVLSSAENGNYLVGADNSKKKAANKFKGAAAKDPQQAAASNLAKESRAKARARARERTREKMCIKQMNGDSNVRGSGSDLNQYSHSQAHQGLQFLGFHQQNVLVSRDLSSNYTIPSAHHNPTSENWDICSFTSQSNLSAILDHHKFH